MMWATSGWIMFSPLRLGTARGNENMSRNLLITLGNDGPDAVERSAVRPVGIVLERWVTVSIFCLAAWTTEYARIALHRSE
jgi:hypothetical protein